MKRRAFVSSAAAGAVALAVPVASQAKESVMVSEQRTLVVRGIYALDEEGKSGVRFTDPAHNGMYPGHQADEMTLIVDSSQAGAWYGKRVTVTVEEN